MAGRTVVILTEDRDRTADRVAAELTLRGVPVIRMATSDFPRNISMAAKLAESGWEGTLSLPSGDVLDFADIGAIYRRRPTQFQVDARMSSSEKAFAYGEARRGFGGVLNALAVNGCLWVNDPAAAAAAEYKPLQLATAKAVGLDVPDTLIANHPAEAHAWAESLGESIVFKPLSGVWHADEGTLGIIYTSPVNPDDLADPALSRTAHMLQAYVAKRDEARAVVVGERVFAIRIVAHSERAAIDWRSDYDALEYEPLDLPDAVTKGLVELHRRLGLAVGVVDMCRDHDGRWWFLETNQNGEWGWLSDEAGFPIASAVADLLQAGAAWIR
ncbi:ATP-grasp ribosomal peptide maturase [Actinocorallia sp. A-T 12471]|uniref:ATP-grasp ribosomal peptide maturase n=1 Tax=Actinocorallia sp. A-T 12471 TaxID=3089813 RepID=UPI0029D076B6|nr:ATP-grasp ribosomal peptide maturase [Actinocorallia sp. A-T 12471]MDX6745093.1 ATP-grasp ribosomal peptide maturase [Actinocorallia sp. A-T 12471]